MLQKDEGIKQEAQSQGDKTHTGEGWGPKVTMCNRPGGKKIGAGGFVFQRAEWRGKGGVTTNRWPDLWNYLGKDSSMHTADLVEHLEKIRVGM